MKYFPLADLAPPGGNGNNSHMIQKVLYAYGDSIAIIIVVAVIVIVASIIFFVKKNKKSQEESEK